MTAPDPGLTDLIAAALGDKIMHTNGSGDRNRAYAAHVALVVEQHTNGRIAENTGLRRELADEQQRQSDASAELRVLRAMVARVEKLAAEYARDNQEHLNTFGQHHPVAGIAHDHLRAALEGEQQ
ncbi:hypothetical protein [Rhodococcus sp. 66b]|uniref:hypothetical protein n=1 Tax=Rhodococcus sp. 66b TaxID=1945511 RepID=UPI0009BB4EF8|nr:hypothetical protein [Rhodococcus sp. 66b]OQM82051.1 hypothetical protein B0E55_01676 [Rhodococcus sp. 66b]